MDFLDFVVEPLVGFMREHEYWAILIVLFLSFGESLAFISLLLPATVILFALGGVIGGANLTFWPLWLAAAIGAALGDWLSFWLGKIYGPGIAHLWPLSRHPELLPRGQAFFDKWGIAGVFMGRFFGPLRASIPLVAGICAMPDKKFQIANVASAFVWATGILAPGIIGMKWFFNGQ